MSTLLPSTVKHDKQARIKKGLNFSDLKSNQDSIQRLRVNTNHNDDFSSESISPLNGKISNGQLYTSNSPKSHAFGTFEVKTINKGP